MLKQQHLSRSLFSLPLVFLLFFAQSIGYSQNVNNILKCFIYEESDTSYLIIHESIFQPETKVYEQGNFRTIGHNKSRISVIELKSGRIIAQKDMGDLDEKSACILLGTSINKLWIYSKRYSSGLQALNPLTLETTMSLANIYTSLTQSIGHLINPAWDKLNQFYGYNPITMQLIVANDKNEFYGIDVFSFEPEKLTGKINREWVFNNYLSNEISLADTTLKIKSDQLYQLQSTQTKKEQFPFYDGNFLKEQDAVKIYKQYTARVENESNTLHKIEERIHQKTKKGKSNNENNLQDLNIKKNQVLSELNSDTKNKENILKGNQTDALLMQTEPGSFFIVHKNNTEAEALLTISKLSINPAYNYSVNWQTPLNGMFYNVMTARPSHAFRQLFGDTEPTSDYKYFYLLNNKLIVVYLIQVTCIDSNTGKIDWRIKL